MDGVVAGTISCLWLAIVLLPGFSVIYQEAKEDSTDAWLQKSSSHPSPPLFPLPLEAILILIFLNPLPKSTPWRGLDWRECKKLRIKRTQLYQVIFRMACHIYYDCIGIFLQDILPFLSLRIYKYHKLLNITFPNREINSCLKSYDKLQPENAPYPIAITLSGMTMLDRELQSENA